MEDSPSKLFSLPSAGKYLIALLAASLLVTITTPARAAESARSTYGAAAAADFGAAVVPEKTGLHLRADISYFDGDLLMISVFTSL